MRFKSPYVAFRAHIRPATPALFDPASGNMTREAIRRIDVEFGVHGEEFKYVDPVTGAEEIGAVIRGQYYDTDAVAIEQRWTDAEKALVEQKLLDLCDTMPEFIQLFEAPRIETPWPTYDKAKAEEIATIAVTIGKVEHALIYEEQNKARKKVIAALEATRAEEPAPDDEPDPDDEDAAALVATIN